MTNKIKTLFLADFEKDLKKLQKRFKTLLEDLRIFIDVQLSLFHLHGIDNQGIVPISGLGIDNPKIFKARKFACKSLKGKGVQSGIRLVYAFIPEQNLVEMIEIYYKGDQENGSRDRILQRYKNL